MLLSSSIRGLHLLHRLQRRSNVGLYKPETIAWKSKLTSQWNTPKQINFCKLCKQKHRGYMYLDWGCIIIYFQRHQTVLFRHRATIFNSNPRNYGMKYANYHMTQFVIITENVVLSKVYMITFWTQYLLMQMVYRFMNKTYKIVLRTRVLKAEYI